jgi:DNA-binding NtrC family response regulator
MEALNKYHWPGNVRQLQNAMERAAALTGLATQISLPDLPEEVRHATSHGYGVLPTAKNIAQPASFVPATIPDEGLSYDAIVARVERELLLQSLNKTGGNKVRAAKLLQMKRTTFSEKLKRLQLEEFDSSEPDSDNQSQAQAS